MSKSDGPKSVGSARIIWGYYRNVNEINDIIRNERAYRAISKVTRLNPRYRRKILEAIEREGGVFKAAIELGILNDNAVGHGVAFNVGKRQSR